MTSKIIAVCALVLCPTIAAAAGDPCDAAAQPFMEKTKMAIMNGDSAQAAANVRLYSATKIACSVAAAQVAYVAANAAMTAAAEAALIAQLAKK